MTTRKAAGEGEGAPAAKRARVRAREIGHGLAFSINILTQLALEDHLPRVLAKIVMEYTPECPTCGGYFARCAGCDATLKCPICEGHEYQHACSCGKPVCAACGVVDYHGDTILADGVPTPRGKLIRLAFSGCRIANLIDCKACAAQKKK